MPRMQRSRRRRKPRRRRAHRALRFDVGARAFLSLPPAATSNCQMAFSCSDVLSGECQLLGREYAVYEACSHLTRIRWKYLAAFRAIFGRRDRGMPHLPRRRPPGLGVDAVPDAGGAPVSVPQGPSGRGSVARWHRPSKAASVPSGRARHALERKWPKAHLE
jgi:hypothetical protein